MALSDDVSDFPFFTSQDGFDAWNSLAQPCCAGSIVKEVVTCEKLDNFALEHNLIGKLTMMKIDVEGWEMRVLKGANNVLSGPGAPVLQIEFCDATAQSAGSSCKKLYHYLENIGYVMFIYDSNTNKLIHDPIRYKYPNPNLIASKHPELVGKRLKKNSFWPPFR